MSDSHDKVPATYDGDPIANPGLPAHTWRPTDIDPKAEKRAERQVAACFVLAMVCTVLFVVCYIVFQIGDSQNHDTIFGFGASNVTLGLTLGGALLFIGIGIVQWARKLMGDHEMVELRHSAASSPEDRAATLAALDAGIDESGIGRRPLVRNTLLGSIALLGLPTIVLLRDAERVLPGLAEYALVESVAGLRPGSPDNLPLVGRLAPGVLCATGHGRNGILLAPVTSDAVLALLAGTPVPEEAVAADPGRLAGREVRCGSG